VTSGYSIYDTTVMALGAHEPLVMWLHHLLGLGGAVGMMVSHQTVLRNQTNSSPPVFPPTLLLPRSLCRHRINSNPLQFNLVPLQTQRPTQFSAHALRTHRASHCIHHITRPRRVPRVRLCTHADGGWTSRLMAKGLCGKASPRTRGSFNRPQYHRIYRVQFALDSPGHQGQC
jgi:hypothetical protein